MFRQTLRRCARPASSLGPALARPRAVLAVTRQAATRSSRYITPLKAVTSIGRTYSSEASATRERASSDELDRPVEFFKDLEKMHVHRNLITSITDGMGYERMTPVQAKTINPALKGTDIVAQAKTGTGKTLAFLLPLLQRMIQEDRTLASRGAARYASSDDIRGIILSPTRELAEQIAVEARALTRNTGLVVQAAVGGTNKGQMLRQTQRQGCHLLVATPGRLNDLLNDPDSGIDAPNLAALVLDEADRMLDAGFERELDEILRALPDVMEKERQTMLVSATIPDDVIRLARTMVRSQNFEFVQTIAENESLTHDQVPQRVVPVSSWANVFPTLFELMDRESQKAEDNPDSPPFKAIVYFNTTALVEMAGEVGFSRRREGLTHLPSYCIHSRLTQVQRSRASEAFRRSDTGILFSSDVTARGMDFPNVTHVIQVDAPRDRESYIHRLGRTGRQDKYGEGWLLLTPLSISTARTMLNGLPIKQDKTLECAEADVEGDELPPLFEEFKDLVSRAPKSMMGSAYQSLFGVVSRKNELAQDLYYWCTRGWGWKAPPPVTDDFVRRIALDANTNFLNIQDKGRMGTGGRFSSRSGRFSSRDDPRNMTDPFSAMRRQARSDRHMGHSGSRGRSGW